MTPVARSMAGDGDDSLVGGTGSDLFEGGSGDDTIDGGGNGDISVFSGAWSDYTITESGGVYTVVDNRPGSPDGTDALTDIETFRFSDGDVTVADVLNDGPDVTAADGSITEKRRGRRGWRRQCHRPRRGRFGDAER